MKWSNRASFRTAWWKVVNLWELNAADFLPLGEAGLAPWIPLVRIDGPPEPVLKQCQDAIVAQTSGGDQENLRLVTEVLAGLRHDPAFLRALFRRGDEMIESPVLDELFAEREVRIRQKTILEILETRFGTVPADLSVAVRVVRDADRLSKIQADSVRTPSLDSFRVQLSSAN